MFNTNPRVFIHFISKTLLALQFSQQHCHTRDLIIIVPDPLVSICDHATPYNGTIFTLTAMIEVDTMHVATEVMTMVTWSHDDYYGVSVLVDISTQTSSSWVNLTFQPLTANSSGNYTLNATVMPISSDFILESNRITFYNLIVQRAFIN